EMLGNFSFGDYYKAEAIPWAWELFTEVLRLDPDRLWVSINESDDEAAAIWLDVVGLPPERVQRLGDATNFWRMADTGPCGPNSEIFWDLGPEFGAEGGPAVDEDRYVELWNLVFMQYDAQPDGELVPLPAPSVDATVAVMGDAYPEIAKEHDLVTSIVRREEERFRQTLARGLDLLDDLVGRGDVSGDDAFFLHDTLGFPVDLTREIAEERGRAVDLDGFRARMAEQRTRAQEAHKAAGGTAGGAPLELYRELLEEVGPTDFTGRREYETAGAKVRGLLARGERVTHASEGERVDIVLDRTPFYAESGGQVGDTGVIESPSGARVRVFDTQYGLPGTLVVHRGDVEHGTISED